MNRLIAALLLGISLTVIGDLGAQASHWIDPSPHSQRFVAVGPGVKLEVLDWGGNGRTLVLLPFIGNTAHVYDDWAPRLAREFHVLGITPRGSGASDRSPNGYAVAQVAADVDTVLATLGVTDVVLLGNGIVAGNEMSWLASHHAPRVGAVVYLDAGYTRSFGDSRMSKHIPHVPMTATDMASVAALGAWMQSTNGAATPESEIRQLVIVNDSGRITGWRFTPGAQEQVVSSMEPAEYSRFNVPVLGIYARRAKPESAQPACKRDQPDSVRVACAELAAWLVKHMQEGEAELRQSRAGVEIVELPEASPFIYESNEADVTGAIRKFVSELKQPRGTATQSEDSIRAAEYARREALLAADTVALSRLTAAEFYEVNRFGQIRTRAMNIQEIASGALKLKTVNYDSLVVHVYGDAAILTGIADNTGEYRGAPFSGRIRYTRVFVRRGGRWQAVAMQHTPMP